MSSNRAGYGAASIGGTAALILAAKTTRQSVIVQNVHATQILYLGNDASVTTSNGLRVAAGAERVLTGYHGALYGIASGAATDVRYFEVI